MPAKLINTAIAAKRLGVTPRRVQILCEQNRIRGAYRIGRAWLIPEPLKVLPPKK